MAPITFYDIALAPPAEKTSCSPNPWKTRYALNFKKTPYKTTWVPLGEISSVRAALNIPASRTFADGSPYQTLPVISDPATGRIVGDSFENAVYLQEQYPSSGAGDLFPAQELGYEFERDLDLHAPIAEAKVADGPLKAYLKFNTNVDAAFTAYTQLVLEGFPFDPDTAEEDKAMMSGRIGVPWEALRISEEKRAELFKAFEETLGGASYADFIVGGWLRMYKGMLSAEEFKTLKGWHNGVFGKLHEALEVFAQMD
ncbi:uncharacterized protein N7443_002890 [Penicillium atrosanguineum]|uniref:uncharacterized protein n=1 Tax=Penicillium atrosanguineum TaxID=1132637 RepID=UPI00239A4B3C|nr:uncharacterized protein N7443_002890 [Penicillium atrosanguineum]KAJ5310429.1 hypothetical protein N7443_002890 [Penicillium atrosanguineum]